MDNDLIKFELFAWFLKYFILCNGLARNSKGSITCMIQDVLWPIMVSKDSCTVLSIIKLEALLLLSNNDGIPSIHVCLDRCLSLG